MGFDLFIAGILLVTTIRGAAKGVAWQLAGIGALVLCFLFATPLSLTLAPMIKLAPPLNRWVAMLGIYLVFSFGTFAIARGFREALEKAKFVEFDRHLGALFGLAKGAIIALVITFFSVAMSERAREYILKTYTGFAAAHIMNALDPVMPRELHAILEPYIHELDAVDPELERTRDEFHGDINLAPGQQLPSTAGNYRPSVPGGGGGLARDPFQDEEESGQTPSLDPNAGIQPPAGSAPTLADEARQFLESIPGLAQKIAPAIKQQVYKSFQNTLEEHRDEFADQLSRAANPDAINQVAQAWRNGRPRRSVPTAPVSQNDGSLDPESFRFSPGTGRPQPQIPGRAGPVPAATNLAGQRQDLLRGIAAIYSSQPRQQASTMTQIETALLGLPDEIAVGALADWLSDLRGDDPDPDPQTNVTTTLTVRIARQVEAQRFPRNRLSQDWQGRLDQLRN